jgi:hypothetical protein
VSVANLSLVVNPKVKELAKRAAKADKRTISALIELLVLKHCPEIIRNNSTSDLNVDLAVLLDG